VGKLISLDVPSRGQPQPLLEMTVQQHALALDDERRGCEVPRYLSQAIAFLYFLILYGICEDSRGETS
jgi:hypothetical protein